MSETATVKTEFVDRDALVTALRAIYPDVEVHEQAQSLFNWMGREQRYKANVIVRKCHIDSLSNDMGFEYDSITGKYQAHFDDAHHPESFWDSLRVGYQTAYYTELGKQRGYIYNGMTVDANTGATRLQFLEA